MAKIRPLSEFLEYLVSLPTDENGGAKVPKLLDLSDELEISVSSLREQLEVAKALGVVDVRPKKGIRRMSYTFTPIVRLSLAYAIAENRNSFDAFADLRNHIEAAYWHEAVTCLQPEDHQMLRGLIAQAWKKLHGQQVQIPHEEHRRLHLGIFRRLDNSFVLGLLEGYWEAYEAVGLNLYADYAYLEQVWRYHERMVEAIIAGDAEAGYHALVEHKDLLYHRPAAEFSSEPTHPTQLKE